MPRRNGHVPAYRLHKPSGQARVIVGGEHFYLGKYGSPESREEYARLVSECERRLKMLALGRLKRLAPDVVLLL
jgi:hypothetical protein